MNKVFLDMLLTLILTARLPDCRKSLEVGMVSLPLVLNVGSYMSSQRHCKDTNCLLAAQHGHLLFYAKYRAAKGAGSDKQDCKQSLESSMPFPK